MIFLIKYSNKRITILSTWLTLISFLFLSTDVVTFDNEFSYVRSKKVLYRINVEASSWSVSSLLQREELVFFVVWLLQEVDVSNAFTFLFLPPRKQWKPYMIRKILHRGIRVSFTQYFNGKIMQKIFLTLFQFCVLEKIVLIIGTF